MGGHSWRARLPSESDRTQIVDELRHQYLIAFWIRRHTGMAPARGPGKRQGPDRAHPGAAISRGNLAPTRIRRKDMFRKMFMALPIAVFALGGSTACATKKFVRTSVGEVNSRSTRWASRSRNAGSARARTRPESSRSIRRRRLRPVRHSRRLVRRRRRLTRPTRQRLRRTTPQAQPVRKLTRSTRRPRSSSSKSC